MLIDLSDTVAVNNMRAAGRLASEVLDYITPFVVPGTTTQMLDHLCHRYMVDIQQTIPAPLNYSVKGSKPFPNATCTSLNHVICHGIPDNTKLKIGDILNIDITVIKAGYYGDTSRMFKIGDVSPQADRLCRITYESMWQGISQIKPNIPLGNVGYAIQQYAEKHGYSVVREFCGHGIGRSFHEAPQVLHYGQKNTGPLLQAGMIFTVEPMINAGKRHLKFLNDGWTVVTRDGSLSAQWEHTVMVTENGYEILTLSKGSPPPPYQ